MAIAHLHGLRDPSGKGDTPARAAQARRLAELVEQSRDGDDLSIVCGDLNLLPDSDTFRALAAVGLTDLVGTADTRTSRYTKPTRHASYLLVSKTRAVRRFHVQRQPEVSDHAPLLLEL